MESVSMGSRCHPKEHKEISTSRWRMPLALQNQMKIGVIEIADLGDFTQAKAGTRMCLIDRG
jgi:hypothetical protein